MSAERYRVTEYQHSGLDFLQIERGGSTHELCAQTDDSMIIGAIRQQSADIAELKVDVSGLRSSEAVFKFECDQLRTKLGEMVGRSKASRDDLHRALGRTDDTIIRLEHELSLSRLATERHKTHIDQCGEELKTTRAKLAAVVAERDRIKGDHDEAAHFARHFIRDDPGITPRGAIIRLGDKCTELFVRLQQVEARLAAIDAAPTVALTFCHPYSHEEPGQLIARPAKD